MLIPMPAPAPGERPVEAGKGVVFAIVEVNEGNEVVVVDACEIVEAGLDIEVENEVAPDIVVELDEVFDEVVAALFCCHVIALLPALLRNSNVTVLANVEGLKKKWQNILSVPLVFAVSLNGKVRGEEASFAAKVLVYTDLC